MHALGLLILRVGTGLLMFVHGWAKAQLLFAGEFEKFADPLGMGKTMSLISAVGAEVGGSLLIILGVLTRFGAFSIAFTMAVAAFVVHGNDPWFAGPSVPVSKEPALLFLFASLALVFTGAGPWSVDAKLFGKKAESFPDGAKPAPKSGD